MRCRRGTSSRRQSSQATEHPKEGEADEEKRGDGDSYGREAGTGERLDVGDGVEDGDEEVPEEDKDGALDGLVGRTRHHCASDDIARNASFLCTMAKSDMRGALTSGLFSWRTLKCVTHTARCWLRIV